MIPSPYCQDDATRHAARMAHKEPIGRVATHAVFRVGHNFYVRAPNDKPAPEAELICMAQRWDANTVQVRYAGARSEWINF